VDDTYKKAPSEFGVAESVYEATLPGSQNDQRELPKKTPADCVLASLGLAALLGAILLAAFVGVASCAKVLCERAPAHPKVWFFFYTPPYLLGHSVGMNFPSVFT
jgi:hypothetical protein